MHLFRPFYKVGLNIAYFVENKKYCSKIIFECVNSTWNQFLMKVVLKKEVCGSYKQCIGLTGKH